MCARACEPVIQLEVCWSEKHARDLVQRWPGVSCMRGVCACAAHLRVCHVIQRERERWTLRTRVCQCARPVTPLHERTLASLALSRAHTRR